VTSVGENEEKANTIQTPLLVFFAPSAFVEGGAMSGFVLRTTSFSVGLCYRQIFRRMRR